MKTETKEVKTLVTRLYCDCGEEMIRSVWVYPTMPAKNSYECQKCKKSITDTEIYPKIEYRDVGLTATINNA